MKNIDTPKYTPTQDGLSPSESREKPTQGLTHGHPEQVAAKTEKLLFQITQVFL